MKAQTNKNQAIQDLSKSLTELKKSNERIERLLFEQKTFFNFKELAEYTGFSKTYLYNLHRLGKIPGAYSPTGRLVFFDRKEIEQWILSNGKFSE